MNLETFILHLSQHNSLNYYIYNDQSHSDLPLSIRLEMKFEGRVHESWGVSRDKDLAFFKALMELIERITLSKSCNLFFKKYMFSKSLSLQEISHKFKVGTELLYPDNSNGAGVGLSTIHAKKSAKMELIERHTLLTALYLNIPPIKITEEIIKELPKVEGHKLAFYYWRCNTYYIVLAMNELPSGGFLFTHSCASSLKIALFKSFEEMVPNIIFFDKNQDVKIDARNVVYNDIMSFNRYWKYSGDRRILNFLENQEEKSVKGKIPGLKNIYFSPLHIPQVLKFKENIFCYRAISPEAQQLFFDNWDLKYINPGLRGKGTIPDFPHFIS